MLISALSYTCHGFQAWELDDMTLLRKKIFLFTFLHYCLRCNVERVEDPRTINLNPSNDTLMPLEYRQDIYSPLSSHFSSVILNLQMSHGNKKLRRSDQRQGRSGRWRTRRVSTCVALVVAVSALLLALLDRLEYRDGPSSSKRSHAPSP